MRAIGGVRSKYKAVDKISRVNKKVVGVRWVFTKYNPSTRVTEKVPMNAVPLHIRNATDEKIVAEYCNSQSAIEDAARYRAKMRSAWRNKYTDKAKILEEFAKYQEGRAPNSWQNDVYYLEKYAFHFFLDKKESPNHWDWNVHFDEFRTWLKTVKPARWERKNLSLNTQNKVIRALNVFFEMVASRTGKAVIKCPQYKRSELNQVTALDLFEPSEIAKIQDALMEISKDSHDLFTVLANTGMRENEALGLCVGFIFEGNIEGKKSGKIHEQLKLYKQDNYYGYICLESQPAVRELRISKAFKDRFGVNWRNGSVLRKPLKTRKKIEPENFRFIPIFDKTTWNIIVDRWNQQHEMLEKKANGSEPRDYLLFDGLTGSMFYNDIVEAFEKTKLRYRSVHKLRHTYLTWFYEVTNENRFLAKKVAGHNEERSMAVYSHLLEQIDREQTLKVQSKTKLKRV